MENQQLLIVEDKPEEMEAAIAAATEAGFEDPFVARDLASALRILADHNISHVVSDLFFPHDGENMLDLQDYLEDKYEGYKDKEWFVIRLCFNLCRDIWPEMKFEEFPERLNDFHEILKFGNHHINLQNEGLNMGVIDLDYLQKMAKEFMSFQRLIGTMREWKDMPAGMCVKWEAEKVGTNVRVCIVTSMWHHADNIQPLVEDLGAYVHSYDMTENSEEKRKGWKAAFQKLDAMEP